MQPVSFRPNEEQLKMINDIMEYLDFSFKDDERDVKITKTMAIAYALRITHKHISELEIG